MSTHRKDRIERIQQILNKLLEAVAKGKPVVVEGKKDSEALRELGVSGTILNVKTAGKSFLEAVAEIEASGASEVILLLDFDRRGKQGTKRLLQDLEHAKVKVNLGFWLELKALVGHDIQCIESLPSYLATAQQKTGIVSATD